MKNKFSFLLAMGVLAAVVGICLTAPTDYDEEEDSDEYLEDDMIIDIPRNGVPVSRRWPNANVYYRMAGNFSEARRRSIRDAMDTIEAVTCVRFHPNKKNRKAYIKITGLAKGCYAMVGYNGQQRILNLQKTPVDKSCFRKVTILHELMHALGFFHQQNVYNRDKFIKINWSNIKPAKSTFFWKYSKSQVKDFGFGYDYHSILHYGRKAFSKNGKDTIVPLDPSVVLRNPDALSEKDIGKINAMYRCRA